MTKAPRLKGRITEITLRGFRSLKSVEGLQLPQLSVLIGANGVGKSGFIRFFEMLGWMFRAKNLQEFVIRHGGGDDQFFMGARQTPVIIGEVKIETEIGYNDYRLELTHLSAGDSLMVYKESYRYSRKNKDSVAAWTTIDTLGKESMLPEQQNKTAGIIYSLLMQCVTYQFHDTSDNADIHKRWDVSDNTRLRADGGNLAAVLFYLKNNDSPRYKHIVRLIKRVLPTFSDFVLEPVANKVLLRWKGSHSDKIFGSHLTSDGSLRLFCLLTLLNLSDDHLPDVLFLDEPELGLHPHAITLLADMMKRVSKTRQIFIATQSPYMVDCFELDNIIIAESSDGAAQLRNLSSEEYKKWLDDDYLPSNIWLKTPIKNVSLGISRVNDNEGE
ncbi:AAA family ATPase [Dickeya dianthicola]|uniref:AAA family ATPase n=1 Tax=Dickeya dianthicola TaxID=204039 RepID=UPI003016BF09